MWITSILLLQVIEANMWVKSRSYKLEFKANKNCKDKNGTFQTNDHTKP